VRLRQPLRFQPVVKLIDPVIAGFALFAHTPTMTTGAIDVEFGFVSSGLESVVEGNTTPILAIHQALKLSRISFSLHIDRQDSIVDRLQIVRRQL
jgi:hypothetical protein